MTALDVDRIQAFAISARPSRRPESSLGSMPTRNGLLVQVTTSDGVVGWGEAWCNFPPRGNLSRMHLVEDVFAPALLGCAFGNYENCRPELESKLDRLARHTGETGPFSHCIAAFDTALADIAARQSELSLSDFLRSGADTRVPVYASTPDVSKLDTSVEEILANGHKATKLKIGYDRKRDLLLLQKFREIVGQRLAVMVDANQNWSLGEAMEMAAAVSDFGVKFIEEPLAADAPKSDWAELAASSAIPIAAGENIPSATAFRDFAQSGGLSVLQPDVAKWGGVSGTYQVGCEARSSGLTCAMHYMGTAVGLAASAHVLAAIGGDGPMELDANPNPLRTDLGEIDLSVSEGQMNRPQGAGIGFVPDPRALKDLTIASVDLH